MPIRLFSAGEPAVKRYRWTLVVLLASLAAVVGISVALSSDEEEFAFLRGHSPFFSERFSMGGSGPRKMRAYTYRADFQAVLQTADRELLPKGWTRMRQGQQAMATYERYIAGMGSDIVSIRPARSFLAENFPARSAEWRAGAWIEDTRGWITVTHIASRDPGLFYRLLQRLLPPQRASSFRWKVRTLPDPIMTNVYRQGRGLPPVPPSVLLNNALGGM